MEQTATSTELVALLNDLLQLDHDAVGAYTLALKSLDKESYRETVRRFRTDHERHVTELTALVHAYHGTPVQLPHVPTGAFKLAVQGVGAAAGDTGVLVAFKSNERQSRDKYAAAAANEDLPTDVREVLTRAAADESRHYGWVSSVLEQLGVGEDTMLGRAESAFEVMHGGMASGIEAVERKAMKLGKKGTMLVAVAGLATIGAAVIGARLLKNR